MFLFLSKMVHFKNDFVFLELNCKYFFYDNYENYIRNIYFMKNKRASISSKISSVFVFSGEEEEEAEGRGDHCGCCGWS